MKQPTLQLLLAARRETRPAVLVTELSDGGQTLIAEGAPEGDLPLTPALREAVEKARRDDRSGVAETDGKSFFIHVLQPPLRLIVVGAVHIAQSLAPMAALAGYAVTIVDPRRSFATDERFPDLVVRNDWPDEAMVELKPDGRTAIVTLTHDPKIDDPALDCALRSSAFYIAALGSRKTHAGRLERLREMGHDAHALARIHGPAGLSLGAVSPAEIAVSILAQMTGVLRNGAAA
ncbi:XdhC family protein [Inquilinus sp. CAU 1745]|uniref:XdhC family protein n=1 Tax=Inquilinus sp. CAU 1745 TaxID=3140369 RepID=UPI00325ADE3F